MSTQPIYIRPTRSIGGIQMDVTIEESHTDELELTEHPVEQGAAITDHAFVKPAVLTIIAGASDSGTQGTQGRCRELYDKLLALQGKREPMDVMTGKRAYKNMLITSLTTTTDKDTESVLIVTAELQEVLTATVQTVPVPRHRQQNGHVTGGLDKRGQQQLEEVPPPKRSSALKLGLRGVL